MVRITVLVLALAIFLSGVTTAEGPDQTRTYDVEGMTCALCDKAIQKSLRGVEGVKTVSVDRDGGRITIIASSDVEPESLARAIESAGSYSATRVEPGDD